MSSNSNPSTLQEFLALSGMKLTGQWADIHACTPFSYRTLLYGPPGTGKTSSAYYGAAGAILDRETVQVIECHDELMVAEARGHFIRVGDRTVWFDGPAAIAARRGHTLLIDEIDHAGSALHSAFRSWLNDPRVVKFQLPSSDLATASTDDLKRMILDGSSVEIVKPAPGFRVVATMNGDREDLDGPLWDRFDSKWRVTEIHPGALTRLPEWMRDIATDTAIVADEERRISVRSWLALAEHFLPNVDTSLAFRAVFEDRADDVRAACAARVQNLDQRIAELRLGAPAPAPIPVPVIPVAPSGNVSTVQTPATPVSPATLPPSPATVSVQSLADARAAKIPVAFRVKTNAAGRPPKPECPHCGNSVQSRMDSAPGSALVCTDCSGVVYPAGGFTVRYKNPDPAAGKNSKWLNVPGF